MLKLCVSTSNLEVPRDLALLKLIKRELEYAETVWSDLKLLLVFDDNVAPAGTNISDLKNSTFNFGNKPRV